MSLMKAVERNFMVSLIYSLYFALQLLEESIFSTLQINQETYSSLHDDEFKMDQSNFENWK